MLFEISGVRQIPDEGHRRWFRDDEFDLIVFYPSKNLEEIRGFQLCYREKGTERVLTWNRGGGYGHSKIDDGEVQFHNKMSPILVADGAFDKKKVIGRFEEAASEIDVKVRRFIKDRLQAVGEDV